MIAAYKLSTFTTQLSFLPQSYVLTRLLPHFFLYGRNLYGSEEDFFWKIANLVRANALVNRFDPLRGGGLALLAAIR